MPVWRLRLNCVDYLFLITIQTSAQNGLESGTNEYSYGLGYYSLVISSQAQDLMLFKEFKGLNLI